jgi:hypothetical protein
MLVVSFRHGVLLWATFVAVCGWFGALLYQSSMSRDEVIGEKLQDPFDASRLVGNATWLQRLKTGGAGAAKTSAKFNRIVRNAMVVVAAIATVVFLVALIVEAL